MLKWICVGLKRSTSIHTNNFVNARNEKQQANL
jgi:hypothetical protein